jgi:hypothetical protein
MALSVVCVRVCRGMGVASWLPKGDSGIGIASFDIGWIGISGVSKGGERAVDAAELGGEGGTAGIILVEEITTEPV